MNWSSTNKRLWALAAVATVASALLVWFGARVVAGPRMMYVSLDSARPTPTPRPVPTSFNHAGKMACGIYQVDYKLWLAFRLNEMGRRGMEMGVRGRNAGVETDHVYFPQAYQAALLISRRQREFSMSKSLQSEFARYKDPFIAYACSKWRPTKWKAYYWDVKGSGVGAAYRKNTEQSLETKIKRRAIEMYGGDW